MVMEKSILVDSSIFIQLLRRGLDPARELLERFDTLDLVTCGMVKLEVLRGVRNPRLKAALESFMGVLMLVPSDNRLWDQATELAWTLDRRGRILPGADLVIAASALRVGAEILTLDGHFQSVPELPLVAVPQDWVN